MQTKTQFPDCDAKVLLLAKFEEVGQQLQSIVANCRSSAAAQESKSLEDAVSSLNKVHQDLLAIYRDYTRHVATHGC